MAKRGALFGWSRTRWVIFVVGGLIVFVLVPVVASVLRWSVSGVVAWTGGIILWLYTLETQAMRQEMVAANKMAVQPLLVTTIENPEWAAGAIIFVKNIGKGPALRIQFAAPEFADGGELDGKLFRLTGRFYTADCLEAGEKQPVMGSFGEEEEARYYGGDWIRALNPRTARANYRITTTYEDMNGKEHKSVMQMGVDGTKLLRSGG